MNLEMNSTNDDNHEDEPENSAVILFLSFSLLAACISKIIFAKILKYKMPIPFTVAVLILALIVGTIAGNIENINNKFLAGENELSEISPHLIYYIFLPVLIFDSSFNSHFHVMKHQLLSAILMAGPGVFISAIIIAICAIYIFPYEWPWLIGLMFGSILSATDPVAVVAVLHDSGASLSLAALIDAESLLNDGSAFVVFLIFHNIIVGGSHSAKSIITDIVRYSIGKFVIYLPSILDQLLSKTILRTLNFVVDISPWYLRMIIQFSRGILNGCKNLLEKKKIQELLLLCMIDETTLIIFETIIYSLYHFFFLNLKLLWLVPFAYYSLDIFR